MEVEDIAVPKADEVRAVLYYGPVLYWDLLVDEEAGVWVGSCREEEFIMGCV